MLVKLGGVKGRMVPALKLDPNGAMAMKESRYPITTIGVKQMTEEIIQYRKETSNTSAECRAACSTINGSINDLVIVLSWNTKFLKTTTRYARV